MEEDKILIGLDYGLTSQEVIETLIEDVADIGMYGEIARANVKRPEILTLLMKNANTPDDVREFISGVVHLPAALQAEKEEKHEEARKESLTTKIQKLSVSARIQLAMKGGREIRGILARDSNKLVMLAVLANGKITESEIELIAKSKQTLEEALREISKNREWMKNYSIMHAITTNPKTPAGVAVGYVTGLKTKDLIMLEKNKNVSEAVRSGAKRILAARKPK